ncbi:heme-dependent oxidative N-demethylase family protein [Mycobacterium sp. ZZG]
MISAPDLIATFPFPFATDQYRYSTNVEPAGAVVPTPAGGWGERVVDIDSEYERELAERATILAADPSRYAVLAHMRPACWDAMLTLMREMAAAYPDVMSVQRHGAGWGWRNDRLGLVQDFVVGDDATLPAEPLAYIAAQVQEDIVLLDQRDGDLFGDAGVVTFAADWSFGFDVGMTFLEIHGPVPRLRATGVITRAREFLMRLQPGETYRRTNWTLTVGRRLDVSTERYHEWGPDRTTIQTVPDEQFGRLVHLRVEVQHLIRLPESGSVCFLIRTYLLPLADLVAFDPWRQATAAVLADLPADMAEYKGIIAYRDRAVQWLRNAG